MLNVQKKQIKTIDDYRHSIKLLKYHLKKESKQNQKLKYESAKAKHVHHSSHNVQNKNRVYSLTETVKVVSTRLKRMGLVLGDLFRMADQTYEGEITKEQFMKCAYRLKTDLEDSLFTEMFYAVDTNFNGMVSEEEFAQFSIAYGGCTDSKQIRKFEKKVKSKLAMLIQRKKVNNESFLSPLPDPIPASKFKSELLSLGMTDNETMLMLKTFDPSHEGNVRHKIFLSLMQSVKAKSQKQQKQEQYEKGIQQLCAQWRQQKLNPIDIFEQADVDGKEGVTSFELEQAFKKLMPGQTNFQIKKWVSMINLNNDAEITKEQFLNSIRSFYSLNQMSKFSAEYEKKHPELKKQDGEEESTESIMKQLSIKIQDSGMTKKDTFNFLDFNKNGEISKEEMFQGLKRMGIKVGFIGRVMSVFDRDSSGEVNMEEWLRILGEDIVIEDVPIVDDMDFDDEDFQSEDVKGHKSKPIPSKKKQTTKDKPQQTKKQIKKSQVKQADKKITKPEGNKTLKKQSKVSQQKQNANKTQKQKQTSKIKKQSVIVDKKFVQDNLNKTQQKKKKQTIKQKPKPISKPKSSDIESDANKFEQPEQINVEPIQTQVACYYKKNKKTVLGVFKKYDKKNTGEISTQNFNKAFDEAFKSSANDTQKKQIYIKNCSSGGRLQYQNWLNQISDMYAQDISEPEQKESIKQQSQGQQNQQEQPEQQENKQPAKKQETKKKNQIAENTTKRGDNLQDFTDLLTLKITSNKNIEKKIAETQKQIQTPQKQQSYKFVNYIDEEGNFKKKRNSFLEKARIVKKNGQKYKDFDFPPEHKSLYNDKSGQQCQIPNVKMLKWKHFSQIYQKPQVFVGVIEPNDIKQGSLGDCYFLSALACLAEYRNMIQRLFEYYDLENGYFLVWMCIDGMWRLIELDGYLPISPDGKTPAFSRSNQEQLWVLLLEKAYAKCYGNYNNIVGGQPFEAIKDLSGAPGEQYSHDKTSMDQIWDKLVDANKKQYMMTAATKMDGGQHQQQGHQEGITSEGVVLGHAYSILDVHKVNKTGERIIQLRNPWGQTEWKGEWSDNSKKWAGDVGIKYQGKADDGIFWMSLKDFFINFVSIAINFISPKNYYQATPQKNVQQFAIKISSKQFQNGYFMVSQVDHRHKGLPPNTPYSLCHMIGFVLKNGQVVQKLPQKRFLYAREGVIAFLNMSKYGGNCEAIVLVQLEKSTDVTVGFYCDKPQADFEISTKDCTTFSQELAKADENNPSVQTVPNQMKIWLSQVQNLGFLCFKNISKGEITWNVEIQNPQNIKIVAPTLVKNVVKLQPGEIRCLAGRLLDMKKGFNFRQKISY